MHQVTNKTRDRLIFSAIIFVMVIAMIASPEDIPTDMNHPKACCYWRSDRKPIKQRRRVMIGGWP